jgi:hypothetical protein
MDMNALRYLLGLRKPLTSWSWHLELFELIGWLRRRRIRKIIAFWYPAEAAFEGVDVAHPLSALVSDAKRHRSTVV